jgi:chloramphenicol 3-O-phosphotransferase
VRQGQEEKAEVLVVRGPIAVGKTSVVQELASIVEKAAIVPVDWLRHMVVGWSPDDQPEAVMAGHNAALLAESFCQAGLCVLIDGPFDDPEAITALQEGLQDRRVLVVTLMVSWEELLRRHSARPVNLRAGTERVRAVYERIAAGRSTTGGIWVDTEGMTATEVARTIASHIS